MIQNISIVFSFYVLVVLLKSEFNLLFTSSFFTNPIPLHVVKQVTFVWTANKRSGEATEPSQAEKK